MNIDFYKKMASGKDTMGNYFKRAFANSQKLSFGGELKKEAQTFLDKVRKDNTYKPYDMENKLYEQMKELALRSNQKITDRTPENRTILQLYGTEYRRKQNSNYWVDKVKETIQDNPDKLYYITDARFINEIEMLEKENTYLVKLNMTEETQKERLFNRDGLVPIEEQRNHPSELESDTFENYNLIIDTDGQLPDETFYEIMKEYRNYI